MGLCRVGLCFMSTVPSVTTVIKGKAVLIYYRLTYSSTTVEEYYRHIGLCMFIEMISESSPEWRAPKPWPSAYNKCHGKNYKICSKKFGCPK